MKQPTRRFALRAALAAGTGVVSALWAVTVPKPELLAHLDGDFLRISALHLDFLSVRTVERLKQGASVAFVGQLTISAEQNSVVADARSVARFALSYDIWEGKFSVVKIGDRLESRRSNAGHMSKEATQAWCLDNLTLDRASLPADRPFYIQLDLRAEDPQDRLGIVGDAGISITRLIDIFSRPPKTPDHWNLSNGPYRLADLRKAGHG